mmetsp:Transcript_21127/g.18737  ORF Transcript_21127/g.18737 Transcript_21127/m.18737 type:complete len:90 (+) Transcript_21127:528-797(+)
MKNGPVIAPLHLSKNFNTYTGGLFTECGIKKDTISTVKIIGWGLEQDKSFYLVSGNKGIQWGENGYAKIQISQECGWFIDGAVTADPKL